MSSLWKQFTEIETVVLQPCLGRKRTLTPVNDRYARLFTKTDRSVTATHLFRNLYNATSTPILQIMDFQRLIEGNMHVRHPVVYILHLSTTKEPY